MYLVMKVEVYLCTRGKDVFMYEKQECIFVRQARLYLRMKGLGVFVYEKQSVCVHEKQECILYEWQECICKGVFVRETQVAAAAACRATDPGNFQLPSNQL